MGRLAPATEKSSDALADERSRFLGAFGASFPRSVLCLGHAVPKRVPASHAVINTTFVNELTSHEAEAADERLTSRRKQNAALQRTPGD